MRRFLLLMLVPSLTGLLAVPAHGQSVTRLVPPPGCWVGTVEREDSVERLSQIYLGVWSRDTRRICFPRSANGSYGNPTETINTQDGRRARGLSEKGSIGKIDCGSVSLTSQGSYTNVRAPVTYQNQLTCRQTQPGGELHCNGQSRYEQQDRPWYKSTWKVIFSSQQGQHLERCFGGIGNGCDGVAGIAPSTRRQDGTIDLRVSVGSILHDNCCLRNPEGHQCRGYTVMQETFGNDACAAEWRKAVYNTRDGRLWTGRFGPYPCSNTEDDLTDKPGRQTAVPSFLGGLTPVTELETASSRRLAAPPGTRLDATDAAFCASGRFRETRGAPGISAWGVCQ